MLTDVEYTRPGREERECKYGWFDTWDKLVNGVVSAAGIPRVHTRPGEIAIDFHIHTLFSHCSISQPEDIILWAHRIGLNGIGIMDHNDIRGAHDAVKCAEYLKRKGMIPNEFLVIPGVEINTNSGHIGAIFIDKDIPRHRPIIETVDAIHNAGGLAVAVHPYHSTGMGDQVYDAPFDAVEVDCGGVFCRELVKRNLALIDDPRLKSCAMLGASDAHYVRAIAGCYTRLEVSEPTLDAVRNAIINRRTKPANSIPCNRLRKLLGGIPKLR